jgi:citrate lyase subunit beta/citryl-CoA lyase
VIHPAQVPIANEAYGPDEEELIWAKKIVDAFAEPDNAGVEVMRLAGRMVERLHERQAKRLLAMAEQIKAMENETTGATKARR